ncbi:Elongation of very long chain fatty acids protein 4 [Eumeta japonica]|uniref:Elongation of very long chain fatty acids protein n=1 Tax=Eumeta variegata TaxID=151549 RepID=A0A4C1YXN4_EUMVA|nr:Elongation of very long chain fatty acids protein 4 [Eumeta japonica]
MSLPPTKRQATRAMMSIFDPLGLTSLILIMGKRHPQAAYEHYSSDEPHDDYTFVKMQSNADDRARQAEIGTTTTRGADRADERQSAEDCDEVVEWLRHWIANPMCYARVGSDPILVAKCYRSRLAALGPPGHRDLTICKHEVRHALNKCLSLPPAPRPAPGSLPLCSALGATAGVSGAWHQRTKDWFLIASPVQGLTLLGVYLMFVLKWGPEWMKNRPPLNMDKFLIVYNALQVLACGFIFIRSILEAWGWRYRWICEPVDFSTSEHALLVASYVYYYFLLKVVDLLDTVFFVLRKKNNQISFLHVYHHTGMVLLTWGAVTYYPGGHGTFVGVINSFVHTVMYGYYLLTVVKPEYKNSFWWKKYITQLQIIQFLWLVIHFAVIVVKTDCAYPRWTAAIFLPQNLFMLILFLDFYIKAYIKKPKTEANLKNMKSNDSENSLNNRTHLSESSESQLTHDNVKTD